MRPLELRPGLVEHGGKGGAVRVFPCLAQKRGHLGKAQLRALAQLLLEPPALGVAGLDDAAPRGLQLSELTPDRRLQAGVRNGNARGGCDRFHELRVGDDFGVVDQRSHRLVAFTHDGHGAPGARLGELKHAPAVVDVVVLVGEPVTDLERRVAHRGRETAAQRCVAEVAEIDDEAGDRRLRPATEHSGRGAGRRQ